MSVFAILEKKICQPPSSRCGRTIPSRPLLWLLELSLVESKISDSLLTVSSSHYIPSWTPPSPASKASILSLLVASNRALIPMLSPSQSSWNKDKVYSWGENIPHCLEQFSDILFIHWKSLNTYILLPLFLNLRPQLLCTNRN